MTQTTLEIIAPSVEEAIKRGLEQLGVSRELVDVEVLDQGSHGFLGLGGRQARVRLVVRGQKDKITTDLESKSAEAKPDTEEPKPEDLILSMAKPVDGDPKVLELTVQVVRELLEKMKVHARVTANYVRSSETHGRSVILVQIQGDDLSILIGRRSETLNALQYITSLIVGKEVGEWVPLLIDVQGYRSRRERQLRTIARRMAEQTIQSGRRQVLEPMPPSERRIIHMELHDHPFVMTESVGEEPNRKVTIVLKKKSEDARR